MRMSHRYFNFSLFQYCMMDWYLQYVSTHGYVVLEIECCKFVDCICVVSVICFWKVHVVFCSIHKITKWFLVLFYHIRISLINFINVKISLQGGAVYISGGSGTFDSCSFDGNTAQVSTHEYILTLRLSAVNLLIAFVLFRSFAFEKFMLCMFAFWFLILFCCT